MNQKSNHQKTKKVAPQSVVNFVGDIKTEFKKVSWTEREDLKNYTKIVVASMFTMGFVVYLIDVGIQGCLTGLNAIFKVIVG